VTNKWPYNHKKVVYSSLLQRALLLKSSQYPAPLPGGAFYFAGGAFYFAPHPFHELAA
jgi:hypothetical protein